jgi:hypothetical protein
MSGPGRSRLFVAIAALIVGGALAPAIVRAACGGVEQEKPHKDVNLGRAPLAIGDSPMLLALPNLADEGYRANARGCRQYPEGLDVIRKAKHDGHLPKLVAIALGSNGVITKANLVEALDLVGKKRILALATPRESGGGSSHDAELVRDFVHKHSNRTYLLDWVEYSAGHSGWFQPDGLHLTYEGAAGMAKLFKKPLKLLPPPH